MCPEEEPKPESASGCFPSGGSGGVFRPARLILCERRGIWAAAMRRVQPEVGKYWMRFPTWSAGLEAFRMRPSSFWVVELASENILEILKALRWMECFAPRGRLAVVAEPRWADLEWIFRQAGAVHFTSSLRAVRTLVQMALQHLKRSLRPPSTLTERIWRRLPWPKQAQKHSLD